MHCPYNRILVQIEKKYNDEITLSTGAKLWVDTSWHPEQYVTIMGKVVAVPDVLESMDNVGIVPEVIVGDEICFNYQVISNNYQSGGHTIYYNLIEENGQEYWMVDYFQVFFIKRDKDIICIGGYVMIDPIKETGEQMIGSIIVPDSLKHLKYRGMGVVKYIGKNKTTEPVLDLQPGETVYYPEDFAQRYEVLGKEHVFLKQEQLLAKEEGPLSPGRGNTGDYGE